MGYYVLTYLCLAVFLLASGRLVYRNLVCPLHLRWELYPLPREGPERALYGGSRLEDLDWWKRRQIPSRWQEWTCMASEILFLRGLAKENRRLWRVSFPFHAGLYLTLVCFGLLVLHGLLSISLRPVCGSPGPAALSGAIALSGWSGMVMGAAGGVGLLWRRLTDRDLQACSTFSDYANLLFFCLFFLCGLMSILPGDWFLEGARAYVSGLLTGGRNPDGYVPGRSLTGAVAIVTASLLIAYLPFTHMSHMTMKYFLYHRVRWDDAPNLPGGNLEGAVKENLGRRPTWMADHTGADGRKTWGRLAEPPGEAT